MKSLLSFISFLRFSKRKINIKRRYSISEWMAMKPVDRNFSDIKDRLMISERKKALISQIRKEYKALTLNKIRVNK